MYDILRGIRTNAWLNDHAADAQSGSHRIRCPHSPLKWMEKMDGKASDTLYKTTYTETIYTESHKVQRLPKVIYCIQFFLNV